MTKEELEKNKLELEIRKLRIRWYMNLEFWKVSIPTLAILISLYFTFGKGILDSEKTKLEIQKEQLRLDITRFEMKSTELSATITLKDNVRKKLENQIYSLEKQKSDLMDKVSILSKRLGVSGLELERLNIERENDKAYYQSKLLSKYNEEREQLQNTENLRSAINKKI
jgi:hypothetical protein